MAAPEPLTILMPAVFPRRPQRPTHRRRGHAMACQGLVVQADKLQLLAAQRLLADLALGAPPHVIKATDDVVHRYYREKQVPVGIGDKTGGDEGRDTGLDPP